MTTVRGFFLSNGVEVYVTITGPDKKTVDAVYETVDAKHEFRGAKILKDNKPLVESLRDSVEYSLLHARA